MTVKQYTVPLTGEVRNSDKIGNPHDDGKIVLPVTGWNNGNGPITSDLNDATDPNITDDANQRKEMLVIDMISIDWNHSRCVVEIDMPTRFEARFDAMLLGKTDAQILSDASKSALVKI